MTKTYEGRPYGTTDEVAFVQCSFGTTICSVNGEDFDTPVFGVRVCHKLVELGPPGKYSLEVWNGVVSSKRSQYRKGINKIVEIDAEAGKLYNVYNKHRSYLRKWWMPAYKEVTNTVKKNEFYTKFKTGQFKRDV